MTEMIIVYESKTGFTKKYADMLAAKTGLKAYSIKEFAITGLDDEIVFSRLDEGRFNSG
jgi:flavodoxin